MAQNKATGQKAGSGSAPDKHNPMNVIHRTLTGDVADIYLRHVPAFKGMDRERVYEMVMSNPALAAECYNLFQKRQHLFAHLLVDRAGHKVEGTEKNLRCGRSIDAVMAMVVRAVAKRHFLARFGVKPALPPPAEPPKREKRLAKFIRFRETRTEPKKPPKALRKATRGDSLYRAMRHHLLHPWQLKLIPHYTPLPVSTVRQLGVRILDYKSVRDLKVLLKEGIPPAPETTQQKPARTAPPTLIRVKLPESKTANSAAQAKAEAMWAVAQGLQLSEVFAVNEAEMRRMVDSAAIASGSVITALTAKGLSVRALVVLLCAFERQLGQNRLQSLFGQQAPREFIERLAMMVGNSGMSGIEDPESIRDRAEVMIRQLRRDHVLPN